MDTERERDRAYLMGLSAEVLRLHLNRANLTMSGTKKALVDRMLENGIIPSDAQSEGEGTGNSDESEEEDAEGANAQNESLADDDDADKQNESSLEEDRSSDVDPDDRADAARFARERTTARPALQHARPVSLERPHKTHREKTTRSRSVQKRSGRTTRRHKKKRHHSRSRSPSDSSSSRSSSNRHRSRSRRRRHRRRHRKYSSSRSSGSSSDLGPLADSPFISCTATPPKHLVRRIKQGKFIKFDKLLPAHDDPMFGGRERQGTSSKKQRPARRQVHDLASWLEAWNIFLAVRVQSHPREALQLVKYQAIMCHLFVAYPVAACLKYDSLFRQAAARDKSKLTAWDHLKEDILVWCATRQPFRSAKYQPDQTGTGLTGSSSTPPTGRCTHTTTGQEICRNFNFDKCTKGPLCSFAHKCWVDGCGGDHSAKSCTRGSSAPG